MTIIDQQQRIEQLQALETSLAIKRSVFDRCVQNIEALEARAASLRRVADELQKGIRRTQAAIDRLER